MKQDTRLLRNPQGTEGLLLEEALRHLQNLEKIQHLFLERGYLPSRTPSVDYYEVYKEYLDGNSEVYRLLDRDGDLLALRSDITLFLAKQLGMTLSESALPVRIFYSDTILRHQGQTDISKNEFFQVGAELVGRPGMDGDAEMLSLLAEVLALLGIKGFYHIGSRAFFNAITDSLPETEAKALWKALCRRDADRVWELLSPNCGESTAKVLVRLLFFIGNVREFESLLAESDPVLSPAQREPLHYLCRLFAALEAAGAKARGTFRIDLSEIGRQNYYTGICFSVYMEGADSAVASGGRYDRLLSQFGFDAPSVGFSLLLRKAEAFLAKNRPNRPLPGTGTEAAATGTAAAGANPTGDVNAAAAAVQAAPATGTAAEQAAAMGAAAGDVNEAAATGTAAANAAAVTAPEPVDAADAPLTIALPKGRLQKKIWELFAAKGVEIPFEDRKLVAGDANGRYRFLLVKNGDLPTYVNYGIAGIGICGSDVIYESGFDFYMPITFPFGRTTMCLAGPQGQNHWKEERPLRVSSKFTRFARDYYNALGIPVEIVKLNGSVELGAVLGLTPYIVDLVETGSTLAANHLEVFEKLKEIQVKMICNPAYYKIHYQRINELIRWLQEDEDDR